MPRLRRWIGVSVPSNRKVLLLSFAALNTAQRSLSFVQSPVDCGFCSRIGAGKWLSALVDRESFISTVIASTLPPLLLSEAPSTNVDSIADELNEYRAADGSFSLQYPKSFVQYKKLLKTHESEVNFKSDTTKGFEVGVAVDPVKIASLEQFGSAEEVGRKVVDVERLKEGSLDAKLIRTRSENVAEVPVYTIEYSVENAHYSSYFIARVTVVWNRLYVCTGKCKLKDLDSCETALRDIVGSFVVGAGA